MASPKPGSYGGVALKKSFLGVEPSSFLCLSCQPTSPKKCCPGCWSAWAAQDMEEDGHNRFGGDSWTLFERSKLISQLEPSHRMVQHAVSRGLTLQTMWVGHVMSNRFVEICCKHSVILVIFVLGLHRVPRARRL